MNFNLSIKTNKIQKKILNPESSSPKIAPRSTNQNKVLEMQFCLTCKKNKSRVNQSRTDDQMAGNVS